MTRDSFTMSFMSAPPAYGVIVASFVISSSVRPWFTLSK